jgi:SAM-dependent methyltransferase
MSIVGRMHGKMVFGRRVERLADLLAETMPQSASVLDVGCGDGSIAAEILDRRPDLRIEGVDVLLRPSTRIPVTEFDGETLPYDDAAFDAVMFVDVLHHTDNAASLLREAARVAPMLVVKDHLTDGALAQPTLRAMDWAGNRHHGVRLPYNYLSAREWRDHVSDAGYEMDSWRDRLGIYRQPLGWVFDRRLHVLFTARLRAQ